MSASGAFGFLAEFEEEIAVQFEATLLGVGTEADHRCERFPPGHLARFAKSGFDHAVTQEDAGFAPGATGGSLGPPV